MTYDEMNYLCVYPFGNIMPFTFLNEPLHMTYDVSKPAPTCKGRRTRSCLAACFRSISVGSQWP